MADKPADVVGKAIRDFDSDHRTHKQWADKVDVWYRAYRGVMEVRSEAAAWRSKQTPKYVWQVVETLTANVVDPKPRWKVRPRAITDKQLAQMLIDGAKANELLLSEQVDLDGYAEKQLPFAKQAFIAGLSVYKTRWNYAERDVPQQAVTYEPYGDTGIQMPRLSTVKKRRPTADNNTVEVVDVRDFIPQEGAVSLDRSSRVTHRVWYSYDELLQLEAQGVYGQQVGGQPVASLKESRDFTGEASSREQDLFSQDRTKGKIEVLEQWRRNADGTIQLIAIGNRSVLLRNTESPFWHAEFPFAACAPVPEFGRIHGVSVVEQIADLQEAAWSFLNQRIDNTELINNYVSVAAIDQIENPEVLNDLSPGTVIEATGDPRSVMFPLQVDPQVATISLAAEEKIKEDLQNIPGASPTLLGQTDPTAQTATEVSLTASLAQRRIALMKQQFKWAGARVGSQWLSNNQRFVSGPRLVQRLGQDGATAWEQIHPLMLQGEYMIELDSMDESLMRQERRAEKLSLFQTALNAAQYFAALPNQPGLNLKQFLDDLLDEYGITDKEAYYSAITPPQPLPQQGQPGAQQGQPGQPGQGVTAPQAYDATSPSNAVSLSPLAALQRMQSMSGGPANGQ